jgi:hypothetical protein
MATKKLDHIVICDTTDIELAEMLGDWLDTNLKTVTVVSYDSTEHLQFPVQTAQAFKKAKSIILCLTDNFLPLRFPLPQFQSCIADDPDCSKGKVLAVAMRPLTETEVIPMISVIDCYSGELGQNRRRFIERDLAATAPAKKRDTRKSPPAAGTNITQNVGKARDVIAATGNITYTAKHVTKTEFTPDERHITTKDVYDLAKVVKTEFNIEGYPDERYMKLIADVRPAQATLVPDPPHVLTSNAGWDTKKHLLDLQKIIAEIKALGVRTSIFVDTNLENIKYARIYSFRFTCL